MLDPASLQILISRLTGIATEMGTVLRRAAFSPNIKERADCSAAMFTADGELLVQAEHIPVHLGSMPASVRAAIEHFGTSIGPNDQIILNDPFQGGTHLNDITLVAPCCAEGAPMGWVANRAHHADVGGAAPGRSSRRHGDLRRGPADPAGASHARVKAPDDQLPTDRTRR
jgi:N-methylhydantoinase B/oxoprolinase/acetone carboxylase alpha subunit